ncbi:aminotransferase class V-fold PLP-dependent enzyme [Gordonia westfalica]|uniref:Selenocysteine lyase/Cysteine desulfurase n=1 Tax=Gordonia westfalica TaxID=158898 RepID=A0A1H2LJS7_9ACTN|nr:aminotransferase class V-fold PLP-dependent enzyme [Gordonia westfalica]SDU81270.1 Selenocysteine lyase/Cysteine desulfurase [Gordonia westfalica]
MTAVLSAPVEPARPARDAVLSDAAPAPFIPALAPVVGAEAQVPVAAGRSVAYANLDYAASAPALASVAAHVAGALGEYASVHRGAGHLSQVTTRRYEAARETVRGFVRGRVDDTVVFTRNTTDAINLAAHITPGDVVVLDIEHHANLLPWCAPKNGRNRARVVTARDTIEDTLVAIEAELASKPASLLAVTAASNVTGEVLPISRLASIAHRHGARILVDAAQLVAHRPISIVSHGIDYLAFSGHKAYAPFGAGVLIGRSDWFDAADPYLAGGGATADVDVRHDDHTAGATWHTGAARHEAGSPNVLGAVSIAEACAALAELGPEAIGLHELRLCERLDAGLARIDGVRPLQIFTDSADRVGIAGFTVDGVAPRAVAEYLSDEHGIGVRDGKFCAHPLLKRLGHPEGAVRASFGAGTTSDDVDRLLDALASLCDTTTITRPELDEGNPA